MSKEPVRRKAATAALDRGDRGDRRGPARRSLRRARLARGRRQARRPRLRPTAPTSSRPSPSTASPSARSSAAHDAGFFEGPLTRPQAPAAAVPRPQRRRRMVGRPTPTPSARCSGPMDDYSSARAPTCGSSTSWARTRSSHEGADGVHFAVWAPNAAPGLGGRRLQRLGRPPPPDAAAPRHRHLGDLRPRRRPRARSTSTSSSAPTARCCRSRPIPFGFGAELRPADRLGRRADSTHFAWSDAARIASAGRRPTPRRAPISIYEVHLGSWQRGDGRPLPDLRRAGRPADPLRRRHGLHPSRAAADHRASASTAPGATSRPASSRRPRRFGTPDGFARFVDGAHRAGPRRASSTGCRRTSRPTRTASPASTAPRSTSTPTRARASTRTGAPRSTISAGSEVVNFLHHQRAVLARDASTSTACASMPWPRCSTSTTRARRASGCPTSTAAARTSRRSPSCSAMNERVYGEHPGVVTIAEESTAWPRRLAAGLRRRPRLRLQVEHGLDARHAAVHARKDPVHRRWHHNEHDLRPALRLLREFRAAAHPRRGGARQGLAARQDARRRLAEVRQPARLLRLHVGLSRQEAAVHGPGVRARAREWNDEQGLDWHLLDDRLAPGRAAAGARPQPRSTASMPALHAARLRGRGLRLGRSPTTPSKSVFAWLRTAAGRSRRCWWSPTSRRCRATATASALPHAGRWREIAQHRRRALWRLAAWAISAASRRVAEPWHGQPCSATLTLPPLATLFFVSRRAEPRSPQASGRNQDGTTIAPSRRPVAQRHGLRAGRRPRQPRSMELTDRRAKPAVYFGGKSRIIDFALSNALNSGIRRIGVATQYKAHSLIRHLQRGWNFLRPERNESFDILPASQRVSETQWYEGTADAVYQNIDIIDELRARVHGHPGRRPHLQDGLRADAAAARRHRRRRDRRLPRGAAHGGHRLRRDACRRAGPDHRRSSRSPRTRRACPASPTWRWPAWASTSSAPSSCSTSCAATPPTRTRATISARTSSPTSSSTARRSRTASRSPACASDARRREAYWRDVGTVDAYWEANIDLTDVVPALDLYDHELADLDLRRDHAAGQVRPRRGRPARQGGHLAGLRRLHRLRRGAAALAAVHRRAGPLLRRRSTRRWSCPTSRSAATRG